MSPIRALLFDFDGLLLETEVPAFRAWQEVYREHGCELSLADWVACVGTVGGFDPLRHLEELTGRPVDRAEVARRRWRRKVELLAGEELRPGVAGYLEEARRLGLRLGIVSSSPTAWVSENLARLGLPDGWDCLCCADEDRTVAKPAPTLYRRALDRLRIRAAEAVAFEDSPNGIRAATAAGIFCVAVPNPITEGLDLSGADLVLRSLSDLPLRELLRLADRPASPARSSG